MTKLLLIAAGGACGAVLRYAVSGLAYRWMGESFPWGTLVVNVLGCFFIGVLWGLSERAPLPRHASAFLFIGVLGAFTTFSTYGLESFNLFRDREVVLGVTNILASNVIGLVVVYLGFIVARILARLTGLGELP